MQQQDTYNVQINIFVEVNIVSFVAFMLCQFFSPFPLYLFSMVFEWCRSYCQRKQ